MTSKFKLGILVSVISLLLITTPVFGSTVSTNAPDDMVTLTLPINHNMNLQAQSTQLKNTMDNALGFIKNDWENAILQVKVDNSDLNNPVKSATLTIGNRQSNIDLSSSTTQTINATQGVVANTIIHGSINNGKNQKQNLILAVEYIPHSDFSEATLTIEGESVPVTEFFGKAFITNDMYKQFKSKTANLNVAQTQKSSNTLQTQSSSSWNYQGDGYSQVLSGSNVSVNTVVIGGSDYFNTSSSGMIRVRAWGTQDAVNYLNNNYYDSISTAINSVCFATGDVSGLTLTGSIDPAQTSNNQFISQWSWLLSYVPYVGGALQAYAQNMNVASVVQNVNDSYYGQVTQNSPSQEYLLPVNTPYTQADGNTSYSEQFNFNANSGSTIQNSGYIEYATLIYDPSTGSDYFAYNDSGTATMNATVQ